jgi:hypothetical protein
MPATQLIARQTCAPFRQSRLPQPVANIADPDAASLVLGAIRSLGRHRGCLAYLYVLADGSAYVISEERPAAAQWMLAHVDYWRGCYTRGATLADVAADLAD